MKKALSLLLAGSMVRRIQGQHKHYERQFFCFF